MFEQGAYNSENHRSGLTKLCHTNLLYKNTMCSKFQLDDFKTVFDFESQAFSKVSVVFVTTIVCTFNEYLRNAQV